jgi:hypothetical protein
MIYEEEPYFLEPIIRPFKQLFALVGLVYRLTTYLCIEALKAITSPYAFSGLVLVVHVTIFLELQFFKSSVIQNTFPLERVVKDLIVYVFPSETSTDPEQLQLENTQVTHVQKIAVIFQLVGFYALLVVYTTMWIAICSYVSRWRIANSSVVVNLVTREVSATIAKDEYGYYVLSPGTEQDPHPWKIRLDQIGVANIAMERVLLPMQTASMKVGAGQVKEMAIPNSYVEVVADFPRSCAIIHNGEQGSPNLRNCVYGTAFKMRLGKSDHFLFTAAHVFKQLHDTKDEQGKPKPVYLRVWRDREKCVKDFRLPRDIVFAHYSPAQHADLISMILHPDLWSALGLKTSVPGKTPRAGAPIEVFAPDPMSHWTKASGRIEKVLPGFTLEHTASTASGTSGSPIFNNGRVVGIHTGAHPHRMMNSGTATTTLLTDFKRESSTTEEGVDPYALQEFEERVNSARQDMLTMLETKKERRFYVSHDKSVMLDKSRGGASMIVGKSWADADSSEDERFFDQDDQDYLDGFDEEAKHAESSLPGKTPTTPPPTAPDFRESLVGSRVAVIKREEVPPTSLKVGEKPSTNLQSPDMQVLHGMLAQIKQASDSLQLYTQLQVPGASSLAEQLQASQATLQELEAKITQQKLKRKGKRMRKRASKASKTGTNPSSTQEQPGKVSQAKPPAEPKEASPLN